MRIWSIVRLRMRSIVARRVVEEELDEELRFHIERQIEEDVAGGMSRDEARRGAAFDGGIRAEERGVPGYAGMERDREPGAGRAVCVAAVAEESGICCDGGGDAGAGDGGSLAIFAFVDAALMQAAAVCGSDAAGGGV